MTIVNIFSHAYNKKSCGYYILWKQIQKQYKRLLLTDINSQTLYNSNYCEYMAPTQKQIAEANRSTRCSQT